MAQPVSELVPQIVAIMQSEGVPVRDPATEDALGDFERRWGVSLPQDMREFYATIDGTGKDSTLTDDLFCIWPLSMIMPIPDLLPESHYKDYRNIADGLRFLCFSDYMIDSDVFAIHAVENGGVIAVCSGHRQVADNFTDFIARFLFDRYSLL